MKIPFVHFFLLVTLTALTDPVLSQEAATQPPVSPQPVTVSPVSPPLDPEIPATEKHPVLRENIPTPLLPWVGWVLGDQDDLDNPRSYDDGEHRLPLWPSRLAFDATAAGATFSLDVTTFSETWLGLPGGGTLWPIEVTLDGKPLPVVERGGQPSVRLTPGRGKVAGSFQWKELPQQIKLPVGTGLLALTVAGKEVPNPSWDPNGTLWLQRQASSEQVDEDFLSLKVHSLIEDGIPLWFETQIELIVAGKSREETLGSVLPKGWQLSSVEASLPVAIDDQGLLKAQLRAGRWNITLRSFQTAETSEISFAEGVTPAVPDQAIAYRADPEFRQAEITGLPQIDVAQTQVPEAWRSLPVYRWETNAPFQLVERVRGPGQRGAAPLTIVRSLWLDDDGKALTYQDSLSGPVREIRRLDAAVGHQLGSVTAAGEPQLITHNPEGKAPGFEVRTPQLSAVATGRITLADSLPATGWQTDAEHLSATLHLPPGYRLFALPGADYSRGDWVTAWTLLDLFLLLLFTLAVFRLRGWAGALLAFAAFALAYHEPGAPRFPWLFLLIPVALVDVMAPGKWQKITVLAKWGFVAILLLSLVPFAASQIQGAIFPQLERKGNDYYEGDYSRFESTKDYVQEMAIDAVASSVPRSDSLGKPMAARNKMEKNNLMADPKAVIQTGPGVPAWSWRTIEFGWDGPVSAAQEVRPMLISPIFSRILGVVRVIFLVLLAGLLLSVRRGNPPVPKTETEAKPDADGISSSSPVAALLLVGLLVFAFPGSGKAQFPNKELLEELRDRLVEDSDAFPGAADIAEASFSLAEEGFTLSLEYHAAARTAVPVPLPKNVCIPSQIQFEDGSDATVLRQENQLWALLPGEGIHRLIVKGRLRAPSDWEWGFSLKPRRISVEAPGWNVSGIRSDGSTEDQLLFSRAQPAEGNATANYDRPDTRHALLVQREVELGLVWRVRTTVSRLSPNGRAAVLKVPLLPGEKVVSAGRTVEGGAIEVRLAPEMKETSWEGELTPTEELALTTAASDTWTERWRLLASSVWNVTFSGLTPTFENLDGQLVPLWQPWPGEGAGMKISRPEAVAGAAVTIDKAEHGLKPGRRQRVSTLLLSLRTSLGEDFPIGLPEGAEILSLTHDDKNIPVRKEGNSVVVPLRPGAQNIQIEWRLPGEDRGWTRVDAVTLPVESSNLSTVIRPSQDRWLLIAEGPLRGPAVRFWSIFVFILIVAVALYRVPQSPLRLHEWLLLAFGLTQVPMPFSLMIVAWLFLIRWRGTEGFQSLSTWKYNLSEVTLIFLTLFALGTFIGIASAGLLGDPEMYVAGNGSSSTYLNWFSARSAAALPQPGYWSVSIWWFRLAMLLWALWLAASLVRWLRLGWNNSSQGGHFKKSPPKKRTPTGTPPALPESN
ncbi:MAG TPA: hypothetical protein PK648_08900 [Verrucomicrobiales bacterium]|nr:hypothetical protein [Verrucomicrobiales bacterium]